MKLFKLFLLLFLAASSYTVKAQTAAELKKKAESIEREIVQLNKDLKNAEKNKKLTLGQINAIRTQIRLRQNKIEVVNNQVKSLDNQIHENSNKVRNLQGQLTELKKEYASMIRFAQRNKNAYDKMMFIFSADNFNQAYKRIKYLQQFGQYRKKQAGYIEDKSKDLNQQNVVLDKDLKEKNTLLHQQQNERSKLEKSRQQQSEVLNKYAKQEKQYLQDIRKRKAQQQEIGREINRIIKRELEEQRKREEAAAKLEAAKAKAEGRAVVTPKKNNSNELTLAPEVAKLSAAFENNKGNLPWPVQSKLITEKFGKHKLDAAEYDNDGINIRTSEDAPVKAVFDGTVSRVLSNYGKFFVLVNHGEYVTVYTNLKSVSVSANQKVSVRQTIGVAGHNGDYPEIQFKIMKLNKTGFIPQNPEYWLAQ